MSLQDNPGSTSASAWRPLLPSGDFHTVFFQGNNDDLILSCCLHYCKDKAKDYMPTSKGTVWPLLGPSIPLSYFIPPIHSS